MPAGTGLTAQIGWGTEATAGTPVAPSSWAPLLSESLKATPNYIQSKGLRNRRTPLPSLVTSVRSEGDVSVEASAGWLGERLRAAIGPDTVTGTGPYVHTFTPTTASELPSETIEISRAGQRFGYPGMRTAGWTLEVPNDDIVKWTSQYSGQVQPVTTGTMSTPTYSTTDPFTFMQATLTLGGTVQSVSDVSISGENNLADRLMTTGWKVNDFGLHTFSGSCGREFEDLTLYDAFIAGTAASFSLLLNAGASVQLEITGQVYYKEASPNVTGPEVVGQSLNFEFGHASSDASAFTVKLTNSVSTAY